MTRAPTYLPSALEKQIRKMMEKMPRGEKFIISTESFNWQKDGEVHTLPPASQ